MQSPVPVGPGGGLALAPAGLGPGLPGALQRPGPHARAPAGGRGQRSATRGCVRDDERDGRHEQGERGGRPQRTGGSAEQGGER